MPIFYKNTNNMAIKVKDLKAWVGNDFQRIIALEIAMNARGAYEFLKQNKLLGANWTPGYETTQTSRLQMGSLLNEAALNSGNPLAYAKMFAVTTPDVDLTRDMVAQRAVESLLRKNP